MVIAYTHVASKCMNKTHVLICWIIVKLLLKLIYSIVGFESVTQSVGSRFEFPTGRGKLLEPMLIEELASV